MTSNKILVVDDEEGIRTVLHISLSESGYSVLTAATAGDALAIVRNEHPAIVLADIIMPGIGGIELLKKIKEEKPDTEVIMMTGHGDHELATNSLRHEAADFIVKPICYEALKIVLKRVHERSGRRVWKDAKV